MEEMSTQLQTHRRFVILAITASSGIFLGAAAGESRASGSEGEELFERIIRPYLVERCYACHATHGTQESDLAVDWAGGLSQGGSSGPAVVSGQPEASRIMTALRHEEDLLMPKGGPRPSAETVRAFERWIVLGAPDPRLTPPSAEEVTRETAWETTFARRRNWWSFQPITRPEVPGPVAAGDWLAGSDHPVDRFLMQRMSTAGISPSGEADRDTLLRRACFVLTGLPPTPEQRAAFHGDTAADAWQRLVERLVASPAFAERWARHWLDCVRYCETHGSEGNPSIPHAWRYRVWCIRAIDDDLPVDQFIREQIAGDMLPDPRIDPQTGVNETALGIGHLRMVPHGFNPTDPLDEFVSFTDNQIDVLSKAFLGMTVSCARCHDHKFDAISQADYYALFGVLASCRPGIIHADRPERDADRRTELRRLKTEIAAGLADAWEAATADISLRLQAAVEADRNRAREIEALAAPAAVSDASQAHDKDRQQPLEKDRQKRRNELTKDRQRQRMAGHPFAVLLRLADAAAEDRTRVWESLRQESTAPQVFTALGLDIESWFRYGMGLDGISPPGAFRIEPDGNRVIGGLLPAGMHSNLLASADGAVLHSPRFELNGMPIRLLVAGNGGARARLAVWNYPRAIGLNYNRESFDGDGPRWVTFPTSYFSGDAAHLEIATGPDLPVETVASDRSWFSLLAIDEEGGPLGPAEPPADLGQLLPPEDPLLRSPAAPDATALATAYARAARRAIAAWRENRATNADVRFLNVLLEADILPNGLMSLPLLAERVARYRAIDQEIAPPTRAAGIHEGTVIDQPLFVRGSHRHPAAAVPRRFLSAIDPAPFPAGTSGRLQLADRLVAAENPLTARVFVNRVWHHLFGRGIVASVDTFGAMGDLPSHPELLDFLASRFVADGWSLKRLVVWIASSRAFRLAPTPTAAARDQDPANTLFSHARLRRLEGEAVRDALLVVSGQLDETRFGPPAAAESRRRSIYLRTIRNFPDPFLGAFDPPSTQSTQGCRDVSHVPAQALVLMNGDLTRRCSRACGLQLLEGDAAGLTAAGRVDRLFATCLGRSATSEEARAATAWLEQEAVRRGLSLQSAEDLWSDLVHAVFNLEEFIHVD